MVSKVIKFFTDLFEIPKSSQYFNSDFITKDSEGIEVSHTQKVPKLYFKHFTVTNFKGIKKVDISFAKADLGLLLGLNESCPEWQGFFQKIFIWSSSLS